MEKKIANNEKELGPWMLTSWEEHINSTQESCHIPG